MMIRTNIATFGVVGTGVIGTGWAARALGRGYDVVAWDPAPGAEDRLAADIDRAWPSVRKLGLYPGADRNRIRFANSLQAVGAVADFIQESAPEDLEIKRTLLAQIDEATPPDVLVATSTSGLLMSQLAERCERADRMLVGHPFNPVYLLPLCEIVGGRSTSPVAIEAATAIYSALDMHPLVVRHEIDGHLSDRLQEAMWREILHIVAEGHATTGELDDAITYGPGLRWAAFGTNLTFHLAGGKQGMRHMLAQFGQALQLPWTKLVAPELTDQLIESMVEGTKQQAAGRSIAELERQRDDYLIATMRALRSVGVGAGNILAAREARRYGTAVSVWSPGDTIDAPLHLYQCAVEPDWVDYNDHMTEAAYLTAFGWATDALFRYIGNDEHYRASGNSFFTAETHINYLEEVKGGAWLRFSTQLLGVGKKRLHFYHEMYNKESGNLVATTEQMLLHVDTAQSHTSPIEGQPAAALNAIWKAHQRMDRPTNQGRVIEVPVELRTF